MSDIDTEAINKLNQYTDKLQKKYIKSIGENYELKYKLKYLEHAYHSKDTLSGQNKINDISEPSFINLTEDNNSKNINKHYYVSSDCEDKINKKEYKSNKFISEKQEKSEQKEILNNKTKQNKIKSQPISETKSRKRLNKTKPEPIKEQSVSETESQKQTDDTKRPNKPKPKPIKSQPISETEPIKQIIKIENNLNNLNIDNLEKILDNNQKPSKKVEQKLDTETENKNNDMIERFKKDHPDEEIALAGGDPLISAIRWLNK